MGMRWVLTVILISLVTDDVEHLCLLDTGLCSLEKCLLEPFAHF